MDNLLALYQRLGPVGFIITAALVVLFLGAFYLNILLRRRYLYLSEELAAYCAGETESLETDMLIWITEECRSTYKSGIEAINTGAVLDTALNVYMGALGSAESFLKRINSLLITTGLFGTFIGLTSAVGHMGSAVEEITAQALVNEAAQDIFTLLLSTFQGMSVAFITSLAGTGFSILFTLITAFYSASHAKDLLMSQLEEYIDVKLASESLDKKEQEKDEALPPSVLKDLSESLQSAVSQLSDTIHGFSDTFSVLKEFNSGLSENLNRAETSVSALCTAADKSGDALREGSAHLFKSAEALQLLTLGMEEEHVRLENLTGVFHKLSEHLSSSIKDREHFLKAIDGIPDRLLNYSEAAAARVEKPGSYKEGVRG